MDSRIEGARAKVQRAKEQFRDLCARHADFMSLNPYGVVVYQDPETSEQVICARVSRNVPLEWSGLLGDIVHNLRASLDYLAWQLVLANDGTPSTSTQFPVCWDTARYNSLKRGIVKTYGKRAAAIFDTLQPCNASDGYSSHWLYALHKLDIRDKHQLLNVVGCAVRRQQFSMGAPGQDVHIERMVVGGPDIRSPLADGAELYRYRLGQATPNVQVQGEFSFDVAFEQAGPGQGEPVLPFLDRLISMVDHTLTMFAPVLRPTPKI